MYNFACINFTFSFTTIYLYLPQFALCIPNYFGYFYSELNIFHYVEFLEHFIQIIHYYITIRNIMLIGPWMK